MHCLWFIVAINSLLDFFDDLILIFKKKKRKTKNKKNKNKNKQIKYGRSKSNYENPNALTKL